MNKTALFLGFILALVLALAGCEQPEEVIPPSGKKIRVGVLGPMTGLYSNQGKSGLEGIKAALKLYPRLKNGDELVIFSADDGNQPKRAVQALHKLVEKDKVVAVLDFSNSASVLAMEPHVNRLKVPLIVIQATHPDIASHDEFVVQLCFDDIFQGTVAALFVRDELLIDRVAEVYNPNNPYSTRLANEFRQKFVATGGDVIEIFSYDDQSDDLSLIMESLRTKGIQLLYMPIKAKCFIDFIDAARRIGWHPRMMGADGLLPTIIEKYPRDLKHLEGLIATDFFSDRINRSEKIRRWREVYVSLFHHSPSPFSALGAEAYAVLCNAMNRCTRPSHPVEINSKLHQTTDFEGLAGKLSISRQGKTARPLIVNTIEDGHIRFIVQVY
jgi:branched-chain amino acid transport system substrate-binding protein